MSGPVRLASPSSSEQGQGSSSHPSVPADVPTSLSSPIEPIIVFSGDGSPCRSRAGSGAMVRFGPALCPSGSSSSRKESRDSSSQSPQGSAEMLSL